MTDALSVLRRWRQDLEGSKQKTYKYALQNAILFHLKENVSPVLSFEQIGKSFVKQYWNNVVYFRFRETTHGNQLPIIGTVLTEFISQSDAHKGLTWDQANLNDPHILDRILSYWDGSSHKSINDVIINPIERLQLEPGWLYRVHDEKIEISEDVLEAMVVLWPTLRDLTSLNWAKFIEKQNPQIPRVLKKVSSLEDARERAIPGGLLTFIRENDPASCFYCEGEIGQGKLKEEIDHFVPFSFVFEHSLWNLVRSCKACNRAKSDRIIPSGSGFIRKLIDLNAARLRVNPKVFRNETDFGVDPDGALLRARQFCENSGFKIWDATDLLGRSNE